MGVCDVSFNVWLDSFDDFWNVCCSKVWGAATTSLEATIWQGPKLSRIYLFNGVFSLLLLLLLFWGGGWNHCRFHTCFHIESFGGEWEVGMARCMRVFERIQLQTIHDIACQLPMISLFLVVKKCCRQCQDRSIQSIHQTWIVGILDLSNWQL